ncbi:MAG: amidohydrolase family protein [Chloroflexota bacterium]|nr:amidohydrolase [Dehalococcoidia bacterium]MDW8252924.1 amidohydrolase family protein [Chloroflexota bacterium]
MIIDTQIHLWEADRPDRPWVPGIRPGLPEPFRAEDALTLMDSAGVDRALIVPPSLLGENNAYALECAARWPDRFAVVGVVDPVRPDIQEVMTRWLDQPGMVGVRLRLVEAERQRWGSIAALDPFLAVCAAQGIVVSLFAPRAVAIAEQIVARHPGVRFVLDHLGMPFIDDGPAFPERERMLGLARFPNLWVKLTAIASRSLTGYPFVETHELLRAVYAAYGPSRMLWGTDHTQQLARRRATYAEQLDLIRLALDFLSATDRRLILGENAAALYGWPAGVGSTSLRRRR